MIVNKNLAAKSTVSDRQNRLNTNRLLWCHNYRQPIRSRSEGGTIVEGQLPQAHFTMWHTCYKHVACNGGLGYTIISVCLCVYKILFKVCSRPNSDSLPLRWDRDRLLQQNSGWQLILYSVLSLPKLLHGWSLWPLLPPLPPPPL